MARPYSMDLRERALARVQAGESVRVVGAGAEHQPFERGEMVAAVPDGAAPPPARWADIGRGFWSASTPPSFASGSREGTSPCAGLWRSLPATASRWTTGRSGLSSVAKVWASKKTVLPSEQDRPDIARKRARWKAYQRQIDPNRLVFIDETWAKTNMAPLRGWGLRGKRLKAKAPYGHWKTMTFLAALRHDRIDAPWVVDGPINGELFRLYVEKVLIPTLKPGDIVILDNLGSHKSKAVRAAIRAAGARLFFLPPYSPDLNPIEQVFAKLKHLLRKAAERTLDATWKRIGALLDCFLPDECQAYLANAGYGST
jgi:transposase